MRTTTVRQLKIFLLTAGFFLTQTPAWPSTNTSGPHYEPYDRPLYPQLALTTLGGCVLLETGLHCWGFGVFREFEKIRNATQIIGMADMLCALADGKVHCHDGMACLVRKEAESYKDCQTISGFDWRRLEFVKYQSSKCDEICYWGPGTVGHTPGPGTAPEIRKNELQILNDHCIATRSGEIGCFLPIGFMGLGRPYFGALQSSKVIRSIVRGPAGKSSCAITDKGIECSNYADNEALHVPAGILNPRQLLSLWFRRFCVLDDKGVICWDPYDKNSAIRLSGSNGDPSSILAAAFDHLCLLSDEGIRCWKVSWDGRSFAPLQSTDDLMPPKEIQELIRTRRMAPEALTESLPRLGEQVYAEKGAYFASVTTALKEIENEYGAGKDLEAARLFTFFALEPVITQLDSPIFVQAHIPNYRRMQERIGREKSIFSLSQVPASTATARLAAHTLHAVLGSTSRLWPSVDTKHTASDLQRKLGVFLAKPESNTMALRDLVEDLQQSQVFEGLIRLPRTKSLGLAAMAITEWLAAATNVSEKAEVVR